MLTRRNAIKTVAFGAASTFVLNRRPVDKLPPPDYGLLLHPSEAGHNEAEVIDVIEKAEVAGINTIIVLVKDPEGLYYLSKLFPKAIVPQYKNFDLLNAVLTAAHNRGMRVDAWLADFVEGKNSWAYKDHAHWAALNPHGESTLSEKLVGGTACPYIYMCPARRPGYSDQYLLPIIKEIASNYPVDAVQHGYTRYPGDLNPDGYCFCDYCLDHVFIHSHLSYDSEPHNASFVRLLPRVDADLAREYTPKPPHWDDWTRLEKAIFLLHGRQEYDSSPDMSYFFYTYRTDAITNFMREAHDLIQGTKSHIEISAAVFKNPFTGGRFLGQKWAEWTDFVDEFMPMTFRNQFNADWNDFLQKFAEYTRYQKRWVAGRKLAQCIGVSTLYQEMTDPVRQTISAIDSWLAQFETGSQERTNILHWSQLTISQLPEGNRKKELITAVRSIPYAINSKADRTGVLALRRINEGFLSAPPPGFFPADRLLTTIRIARENGADGIVLYGASVINGSKFWGAVKEGSEIMKTTNVAMNSASDSQQHKSRTAPQQNQAMKRTL